MKKACIIMISVLLCAGCGPVQKTESSYNPEETVSDGYMAEAKTSNAYSISKSKPVERHYNSIYDMLQTISGVTVNGTSIRIRGGNNSFVAGTDPLVLVDGSEAVIDNVNPADVHSITVLKDGSSSMYGVRGANGVILITTKGAYQIQEEARAAKKAEREAKRAARKAS